MPVTTEPIYTSDAIRIRSQDDQHWLVEWSYEGDRMDTCGGAGWCAVLTGYDPKAKHKFEREFISKHTHLVPKSPRPIVLQYGKVYTGGSRYSHEKYGGSRGTLVVEPAGEVREITDADAVTILNASKRPATPTGTITPMTISWDRSHVSKEQGEALQQALATIEQVSAELTAQTGEGPKALACTNIIASLGRARDAILDASVRAFTPGPL